MDFLFTSSFNGINIFINSVFPVLFPFAVTTHIINSFLMSKGQGSTLISFIACGIGGYPLCAKLLNERCSFESISNKEAKHIFALTSVTGPGFIIGTVGFAFLSNEKMGILILICHYLSALINGLIFSGDKKNVSGSLKHKHVKCNYSIITDAIFESIKAMAVVFAYIELFVILTGLLDTLILNPADLHPILKSIIKGLLEMTIGCQQVSMLNVSISLKSAICAFLISFGGLSVMGQCQSLMTNTPISFFNILKIKLSQGVIAFIFTFILGFFVLK